MFHNQVVKDEWREENIAPFDELILTWNGSRPIQGNYQIYVSLKAEEWSPYLLYATWGADHQMSFLSVVEGCPVRAYQDAVEVLRGQKATGFQIKIVGENGAELQCLRSLHVFTNDRSRAPFENYLFSESMHLDVQGLSQRNLPHPRAMDLCSPTSTSAVVRYLLNKSDLDPVSFAQRAWDQGFDIFGNWVLNVVEASNLLGGSWDCWVERLSGFADIYAKLKEKTPVVVSVRGPLVGSALPYGKGHLLVVMGFDAQNQQVLCMDPAFPTKEETLVSYPLQDFLEAWGRRGFISYIFHSRI